VAHPGIQERVQVGPAAAPVRRADGLTGGGGLAILERHDLPGPRGAAADL